MGNIIYIFYMSVVKNSIRRSRNWAANQRPRPNRRFKSSMRQNLWHQNLALENRQNHFTTPSLFKNLNQKEKFWNDLIPSKVIRVIFFKNRTGDIFRKSQIIYGNISVPYKKSYDCMSIYNIISFFSTISWVESASPKVEKVDQPVEPAEEVKPIEPKPSVSEKIDKFKQKIEEVQKREREEEEREREIGTISIFLT